MCHKGVLHNPPTLTPTLPTFCRSDKVWTKTAERPLRSTGKAAAAWCMAHFRGVPVPWAFTVSMSSGERPASSIASRIATSLATKQLVDPLLAAWLPNIGMAAIGVWLLVRLR